MALVYSKYSGGVLTVRDITSQDGFFTDNVSPSCRMPDPDFSVSDVNLCVGKFLTLL